MEESKKEKAIRLRKEGKTYNEILKEVSVAKSTLSIWLRDVGLSKPQKQAITEKRIAARLRGAAARRTNRLAEVESMLKIGEMEIGTLTERELWLIGTTLYWAEGSKQRPSDLSSGIMFANQDYRTHKVVLKWLELLGIEDENITFELYVHKNRFAEHAAFMAWWSVQLGRALENSCRVYSKPGNPKTNRQNTQDLYHGLLRIRVKASTTLNRRVDGWISGIATESETLRDRLMVGLQNLALHI